MGRSTKSLIALKQRSSVSRLRTGLATTPSAPARKACSRTSSVEMTYTGMCRVSLSFFKRSRTRQPSMSGRQMSRVSAAGLYSRIMARADAPSGVTSPLKPVSRATSSSRRAKLRSFSTISRTWSPGWMVSRSSPGSLTDFGVSWEFIDPVPLTRGVQSVFDVVALPGGLTYACGQDGVMRSPNGRTGWQALPAPYDLEGPYRGYCSMAVHPDFPLAVFVVFSRTTYFDSIFDIRRSSYFASFDGGQTWRFLLHPDGIDPKFHKRVPMVAVNRRSYGLDVWLGAGNLFRMPCVNFPLFGLACPLTDTTAWKGTFTDGAGELFKAHGDTGDVLFDPHPVRDACPLMYSSDGGVFYNAKDEEPGCHDPAFVAVNTGLHAQLLLGMAGVQRAGFEASDVYMALQDDGLFATLNAGASKPSWNHGGTADWLDVVADSTQSLGSIATSAGSILFRGDPGFFNLAQVPNTPALAVPFFVGFTDAVAQWGPSS